VQPEQFVAVPRSRPAALLPCENAAGCGESGVTRGATAGGISQAGAPPGNTAPANYGPPHVPPVRILRRAVDSLYLSYPGNLSSEWEKRLTSLKLLAQSEDDREIATAQALLGGHLFEVGDRGRGRFPFVLVDNCYRVQVSASTSHSLPLAHVQVASEALTVLEYEKGESELRVVVNSLGMVTGEASLSRVDLCVDFVTDWDVKSFRPDAWVTRARKFGMHYVNRRFSGWSIGLGGDMSARLYDKTLELETSRKDYLRPLWREAGWRDGETVWRLEFQFRRPVLIELGVFTVSDLGANLGGMWRYASENWLRLTVPDPDDSNRTRWPLHPVWEALSRADWNDPDPPLLARLRKERVPSDESLFINGMAGITSFMAREGIRDLDEGLGEFIAHAHRFHDQRARLGKPKFRGYVTDKVALKGRKFNTLRNESREEIEARRRQAEAYRARRDGDDSARGASDED